MHWADLRDSLCSLYPTPADAERVAADALLTTRYLTFDGSCTQVWERVLREANRRGKLLDLVRVAEHEYPEHGPVKIARVILESGGQLRQMPMEETPVTQERRDAATDVLLNAIDRVHDDVRDLRRDGDARGEALRKELSDLRHEARDELAALKPLVQAHGLQLRAHAAQLEAQAKQMDATSKRIESLEDRPESESNRLVVRIALGVGLLGAVGGSLLNALWGALWGG